MIIWSSLQLHVTFAISVNPFFRPVDGSFIIAKLNKYGESFNTCLTPRPVGKKTLDDHPLF